MSSSYPGVPTLPPNDWPTVEITCPTDGDARNAASVNVPLQKLADLLATMKQRAAIAAGMTFPAMPAGTYYGIGTYPSLAVAASPGGRMFVAVGASQITSSPDGVNWTSQATPAVTFRAFAANTSSTVIVAVGDSSACYSGPGPGAMVSRTIPAGSYNAVIWDGSKFVAVGASVCATSPDGTTWTSRTIPAGTYRGLALKPGASPIYVAVGDSGVLATSSDGITWSAGSALPTGTSPLASGNAYKAVAWNGTYFCAVGANGACATSATGTSWTGRHISYGNGGFNYNGIAWNGRYFMACGATVCAVSYDGISWIGVNVGTTFTYNAIAWGGDNGYGTRFALVGTSNALAVTVPSP